MRRVMWRSLVLAGLASVIVGCGDDDGGDDLSLAEWQERTTEVCNDYEPRVQAQADEQPDVTSAEELVALIDAITPLNVEYREAVVDVGVPDERAEEVEALHEGLQAQEDLAMEVRDAAADEGLEAAGPLLEELEAGIDDLDQRAEELGVPACGAG